MPLFLLADETTDPGIVNIGRLFEALTGWMQSIVTTIISSPILMIGLGIFVVGAVDIFAPL